jgi:hypothetical protein
MASPVPAVTIVRILGILDITFRVKDQVAIATYNEGNGEYLSSVK